MSQLQQKDDAGATAKDATLGKKKTTTEVAAKAAKLVNAFEKSKDTTVLKKEATINQNLLKLLLSLWQISKLLVSVLPKKAVHHQARMESPY